QPTQPQRGGQAVLDDVIGLAQSLQGDARKLNIVVASLGICVAELVDGIGHVLSDATIRWLGVPVNKRIHAATGLTTFVDADVRAAARGEALLGAGRGFASFLFVTVGTGISASFVLDQIPYTGARGLTGTFASSPGLIPGEGGGVAVGPPLEQFAAGPA